MHKPPHILVALYDAHPEHEYLSNPAHASTARALGEALGNSGIGIIGRIGSPLVASALSALGETGVAGVALSPATTRQEHEIAYRLPHLGMPTIFTGRGAYGADTVALASSQAIVIVGSHLEILENILEHAKDEPLPIFVLTNDESSSIHDRVRALYPNMFSRLTVLNDPQTLAREISNNMRRRQLGGK